MASEQVPDPQEAPAGDDPGPTARRIIVGAQLRRLREGADVSRSAAGYHIRGSESKISRMESGKVGFKLRDVEDLLSLYGEHDDARREHLLGIAMPCRATQTRNASACG